MAGSAASWRRRVPLDPPQRDSQAPPASPGADRPSHLRQRERNSLVKTFFDLAQIWEKPRKSTVALSGCGWGWPRVDESESRRAAFWSGGARAVPGKPLSQNVLDPL